MVAGRQRDFEIEKALSQAMFMFWEKGYLGASLTDLTSSMGINKPSMYAAFGNKEALFIAAAEHYSATIAAPLFSMLKEKNLSLRTRIRNYLRATAQKICDPNMPKGCFITVAANELASECLPEKAQQAIIEATNCSEKAFLTFFADEQAKGHLLQELDLHDITLFMLTILHGQAAMARNDRPINELYQAIDFAMLAIDEMIELNTSSTGYG